MAEELYIDSVQIDPKIVEKYNIKKGMKTPFTNRLIVDKQGDGTVEYTEEKTLLQPDRNSCVFTAAEAIDIAQGADS